MSYYDRSDNKRISGAVKSDAETMATALQYKKGAHKVVIRYQNEDIEDGGEFTTMGMYYRYAFDSGFELQTRIYNLDNGMIDGKQMAVGVIRRFSKRGELFAEYTSYDDETAILKARKDNVTVGLKINF